MNNNGKVDLRDEAIDACLNHEAFIQLQMIRRLRTCLRNFEKPDSAHGKWKLLERDNRAANPVETLRYWDELHIDNDVLKLHRRLIENDTQPVFAAVSLRTLSANPTIFIPVPYQSARLSSEAFKDALWLSDSAELSGLDSLIESAARTISHCLANGSYSVRLGDSPHKGWLAMAHVERKVIYIPDVRQAHVQSSKVVSVATAEEEFLGMASVLYLPLPDGRDFLEGKESAPVAILMWSPVPRRWDSLFAQHDCEHSLHEGALIVTDASSREVLQCLAEQLNSLFTHVSGDRSSILLRQMESLTLVLELQAWIDSQGDTSFAIQFDRFFHGSLKLARRVLKQFNETVSVRTWLDDLVRAPNPRGFVKTLERQSRWHLRDKRLHLVDRTKSHPTVESVSLGERGSKYNELLSMLPPTASIPIDLESLRSLATSPIDNICKYAIDLNSIEAELTHRFFTVSYVQKTNPDHIQGLVGDEFAFRRYYAIRRGLWAPRLQTVPSTGLGLWLWRTLANRLRVFSILYMSPDGRSCHTEIAVPYELV